MTASSNSDVRPVGKLQRVQGGAHHRAEVGEDKPIHGLYQVGGQGDWSVVGRFLGMCCFRNWDHTGGLPQDGDLLQAEAQIVDVAEDLGELVCTGPQQPGTDAIWSCSFPLPQSTSALSSLGLVQWRGGSEGGNGVNCRGWGRLGTSRIAQVDFPPKELVSYSKETQTLLTTHPLEVEEEEEDEEMDVKPGLDSEPPDEDDAKETKDVLRELTEEERQQILHSAEFQSFFDCSIRVMERALAEDTDIYFDYSGRDLDVSGGSSLSFSRLFYDEHWSKHRVITCLDWSPQYPELLVASYNNNEDAPHEPDGVALVWNIKFKKATPEYIYHCQSPVVSVGFARFHPNLVVGGTYSGQIVLWDNRSHRRTPVQRTPLSAAAHTHPVYCVNVVGTQNANNLISVSTDGRMCSWSLDMLSQPQETMELVYNKSKPVAVTCMDFPTGDVNNYVVGSEEGTVYTASRHGSKAGICEMFDGHQGPVTGISCHSAVGPMDFSHLFITSSFDWTVKLWSTKHNRPLYSFEDNADYVYDAMWSPVHPAMFAAVDGMGRLDLWNLNNDTEVPTASVIVEGASALNRVRWSATGKEVSVGDSEGRVWVYDTGELSVAHSDDWARFARTLVEIRASHGDEEEEGPMELSS
uniref:Dynein cytoplasmic 1 intermediate chain 1 n=1 Tax=Neogobius melanostomus TaxID=47308 RepID=A0A8C6UQL5_9GOBI